MSVSDPVPLRADARRNLQRILDAARAAFAERGLEVGVEEIARRAGVGKATFFRRFPSKDALVFAVLLGFLEEMEASAERALDNDDPFDGLRQFLMENARMQADNAGFFDAMATRYEAGAFPPEHVDRAVDAAGRVLARAQEAGAVRPGLHPGDVTSLMKMLGTAVRPTPGVRLPEAKWERYLELLLSGLRSGQDALPGVAMDPCAIAAERSAQRA